MQCKINANIFIFIQRNSQIRGNCVLHKYFRNFSATNLISESFMILILRSTGMFKAHHSFRPIGIIYPASYVKSGFI